MARLFIRVLYFHSPLAHDTLVKDLAMFHSPTHLLLQVTILPFGEWKRIKEKFLSWKDPTPVRAVEEGKRKDALHQQSKSIVQHWENTIEGQRLKRLEARKLREDEEEV